MNEINNQKHEISLVLMMTTASFFTILFRVRYALLKTLVLLTLSGTASTIFAQQSRNNKSLLQPGKVRHLTMLVENIGVGHGLSQGLVKDMAIDNDGYLWVATKDGLNRYDGTGFKIFRHDPYDPHTIVNSVVQRVFVDSKDRIWSSSPRGDIDLFDRATETFLHFPARKATDTKAGTFGVFSEDKNGNIVVFDDVGFKVIITKSQTKPQLNASFEVKELSALYPVPDSFINRRNRTSIRNVFFTADGTMVLTGRDTLYIFTTDILKNRELPIVATNKRFDPGLFDPITKSFYVLSNNTIELFDVTSKTFIPYRHIPAITQSSRPFIDAKNRLWHKPNSSTMFRIHLSTGHIDSISLTQTSPLLFPTNGDDYKIEDKSGNIYSGTSGRGILKIIARSAYFRTVSPLIYPNNCLVRIAVKGDGRIYSEALLNRWISCREYFSSHDYALLRSSRPSHLICDSLGNFLRISYWDIPGKNAYPVLTKIGIDHHRKEKIGNRCSSWLRPTVHPIFFDNDGGIWFAEEAAKHTVNFCHYNHTNGNVEATPFPVHMEKSESDERFIADWHVHTNGIFWLATKQGLFSFDPAKKKFRQYTNVPHDRSSLSNQQVLSLCPDPHDPDRFLWVGTEGGGLNKFDKTTGKFKHFTTKDGLPNDVVYGILPDLHDNLWLSTNTGLCLFNTKNNTTRNFDIRDGFPNNEFNRFQYAHDSAGRLYFGGVDQVVSFDPEDFYKKQNPTKAIINRFAVLNKEITYSHIKEINNSKKYQLSAPIELCKELSLNYDENIFTLGFTTLDLSIPSKNKFRYMLEGFHKDWIDATGNEAVFTNIDPGTYTFKVLACNSSNAWSESPTTLLITIHPPWWGTWWFRLLMVLTVMAIIYALYRYRLKQALKVERLKNSLARNLHDDIGSALSSNALYAEVLKKKANNLSGESRALLDRMINNTSEIMENMNDIVWATKEDMDSFESVIYRMRNFSVDIAEAKGVELTFNEDKKALHLNLKMQQRRNIYLFYKEAINNAIKHSGCKSITVDIICTSNRLDITVADDGKGFIMPANDEDDEQQGNGLSSMQFRAIELGGRMEILTEPGAGTTVKMSLPLK